MKICSFKVYTILANNAMTRPENINPESISQCEKDIIHLANPIMSPLKFGGHIKNTITYARY